MSHFYLTLPSNSSMEFYLNNTLTNYTTKLAGDVSLRGEWEVGLAEIIFPKNWLNLPEDQTIEVILNTIKFPPGDPGYDRRVFETDDDELDKHDISVKVFIPKGYYKNVKTLINEINKQTEITLEDVYEARSVLPLFKNRCREKGFVRFSHNENSNATKVYVMEECELRVPNVIIDMLGFSRGDFPVDNFQHNARIIETHRMSMIDVDRHAMFVYCNLVERIPVGDTTAPLLRVVDMEAPFQSIVHRNFDHPRYMPLRTMSFDTLEIDLRDNIGRSIPFESGTVIVTLHFRRTSTSYLLA